MPPADDGDAVDEANFDPESLLELKSDDEMLRRGL